MLDRFLNLLLNQNGTIFYLVVGLVVFAEDALFVGFVLPGETVAILGGVAASRGNLSVVWMCVIVVVAAVVGDTIGYEVGARYGTRLLNLRILRKRQDRIDAARALLARYGGPAVFFGRYIAFFRAIMPFLAGASHMPYPRFLLFNALGGTTWGIGSVLLGFLAGNSYAMFERAFGQIAAFVGAGLVVAALIAWLVVRHRRRARQTKADEAHSNHEDDNNVQHNNVQHNDDRRNDEQNDDDANTAGRQDGGDEEDIKPPKRDTHGRDDEGTA
jgi:membrane-associated protein